MAPRSWRSSCWWSAPGADRSIVTSSSMTDDVLELAMGDVVLPSCAAPRAEHTMSS